MKTKTLSSMVVLIVLFVSAATTQAATYKEERVYDGWNVWEVFDATLAAIPPVAPWKLRTADPKEKRIILKFRAMTVLATFEQLPEKKVRATFVAEYAYAFGKHRGDMQTAVQQAFALLEAHLQRTTR